VTRVTALRKAGRASVEVEVDGKAWRKLPAEVALACSLRPGLELDRLRLRSLRRELRRVEALATAARLLRHRELGADRLDGELERRRVAPVQRREAVETLKRSGLVDDARLATARAGQLAARGYGDEAIRWRLTEAGLGESLVDDAVAALDPEASRARVLVDVEGATLRTLRLLARRGFSEETVESVVAIADVGGPALG
jgi:SOS response regulatory protein OraA/RecX